MIMYSILHWAVFKLAIYFHYSIPWLILLSIYLCYYRSQMARTPEDEFSINIFPVIHRQNRHLSAVFYYQWPSLVQIRPLDCLLEVTSVIRTSYLLIRTHIQIAVETLHTLFPTDPTKTQCDFMVGWFMRTSVLLILGCYKRTVSAVAHSGLLQVLMLFVELNWIGQSITKCQMSETMLE